MPADPVDTSKADVTVRVDEGPAKPGKAGGGGKPSQNSLDPRVQLTMGLLWFRDNQGKTRKCIFQFNPTELERSRTVKFTRTPTGNTLEEPDVGPRNQVKRKHTRKPDPWELQLSLRYDAGYYPHGDQPAPGAFSHKIARVDEAMRFFEALAEPDLQVSENENVSNAQETPPPPLLIFQFGTRMWRCAVKTLRIKEQDFTVDLYLRRFEVTLGLEVIETVAQNEQGKTGGRV